MSKPCPPAVVPLVQADLEARMRVGMATYGVPLAPHNGRNGLQDAYEEALDLCCYLKQVLLEAEAARTEAAVEALR